jgi:FkbH-like protein
MDSLRAKIRRSLDRDRDLPLRARMAKGARYVMSMALAPRRLRACNGVGKRARAIGRPHVQNGGKIAIGDDFVANSTFAPVELFTADGGSIEIGHRVRINYGTSIAARGVVRLADDVSIGPYTIISDGERDTADAAGRAPDGEIGSDGSSIEIGEGVWIAGRVTVLPGTRIGAHAVITAGSIVSGDIPPRVVAGGIPARVLRELRETGTGSETPFARPDRPEPPLTIPAPLGRSEDGNAGRPSSSPATLRAAVFADFTLGDFAVRLGDDADAPSIEVVEAPFGQVMQSLMRATPDVPADLVLVWTRPEVVSPAFLRLMQFEGASESELVADVDAFCDVLVRGAQRYRFGFVVTWTLAAHQRGLGMLDARPGGLGWALGVMNQRLMARMADQAAVFVLDAQRWMAAAGRSGYSPRGWYLGKVAFQGELLAEAARDVKAAVRGLTGGARKLLVLDLDDTLWGGIVGDLGWENLRLGGHDAVGEAFVDFQKAVKQLTRRGVVLAVVSKNTEAVALEAMRSHAAMVLRPEDLVGWRINWNDKARNISDLAAELNLGLQSVVFIDDNPAERARVRETLPEVLVPEWPEDPLLYPSVFASLRCFDVPAISREDTSRTAMYAANVQRESLRREVGSLDEWLLSLGLAVRVKPLDSASLPRAAQLLNKTNQMNLSTRRLTESELSEWTSRPGRALWTLEVSDRFGDAGLTGLVSVEEDRGAARIVDFVLSCRVMGRRIEETMVHQAVEWARGVGLSRVEATYLPTAKNAPCHDFWRRSGFLASADDTQFSWDTEQPYPLPPCVSLTAEPTLRTARSETPLAVGD